MDLLINSISIPDDESSGISAQDQNQDLIDLSEEISSRQIYPASEPQEPDIPRQRQQFSSNIQLLPDSTLYATEPRSHALSIPGNQRLPSDINSQATEIRTLDNRQLLDTLMQDIIEDSNPTDNRRQLHSDSVDARKNIIQIIPRENPRQN